MSESHATHYVYRAASGTSHIIASYTASTTFCGRDVAASEIPVHFPQGIVCEACTTALGDGRASRAVRAGIAAVVVVMLALLAGCSPVTPAPAATVTAPLEIPIEPLTMAVVGDSISSWNPPFMGLPEQSWVTTASASIPLEGGWARPGARLDEMLANVEPAPDAYVLVVMGGTNDIGQFVPVADRIVALDALIAKADVERVVISTVAPIGFAPSWSTEWNLTLADYAATHGYALVDPWAAFRTPDGNWVAGASLADQVHPCPATAARVGARLAADLQTIWRDDRARSENIT